MLSGDGDTVGAEVHSLCKLVRAFPVLYSSETPSKPHTSPQRLAPKACVLTEGLVHVGKRQGLGIPRFCRTWRGSAQDAGHAAEFARIAGRRALVVPLSSGPSVFFVNLQP